MATIAGWPRNELPSIFEHVGRAASIACDRLGMKAPIEWILVLGAALRAHRPVTHRRLRAVVGQAEND